MRNDLIIKKSQAASLGVIVLILLLAYGLMVSSALRKSATVDEQSHLFRGVAYLETGATHFLLGHPLLGGVIPALPLLTEPNLSLPVDDPSWVNGNWSLAGDAFLWRVNDNPLRLLFLGRLPIMWLTLLLGTLVFRWGRELGGGVAGLLAMALLLFDPNILAHGRLITDDLSLTFFFTLAVYGFWRWAHTARFSTFSLLLSGLGLGLAGATKFNAALLVPTLGLIGASLAVKRHSWRPILVLVGVGLIGWLVIWAVYGFQLWRGILPGGVFWDDLFWVMDYFDKPHGAYLAGRVSSDGWWYYFPVAFLIKTPLPTLVLLTLALGAWALAVARRYRVSISIFHTSLFLLLPPAIYLLFGIISSFNIGYRHLLPMLPFLSVFSAVMVNEERFRQLRLRFVIYTLQFIVLMALFFVPLLTWPDYIPYFNLLTGENGWRILSDSNVDWGQDLPALADWQQAQDEPIKLSYFGTAHPSVYGLDFEPLPTWPPGPEQTDSALQPFNPTDPAPGLYAISVTNLHGVVLGEERDTFAWFREREPMAKIGGSVFVYDVPARGSPANVAFSGLRPVDLPATLHNRLGTNDVRVRWFDAATSFVWPSGSGWMVVPTGLELNQALAAYWPETATATAVSDNRLQSLYRLPPPPEFDWPGPETKLDGLVTFLGYERMDVESGEVVLMTAWRVEKVTERPLKIFVHALDEHDQIIGQWDGLDVATISWLPGDIFVQSHRFAIDAQSKPVSWAVGLYDGETLVRLADRILLED